MISDDQGLEWARRLAGEGYRVCRNLIHITNERRCRPCQNGAKRVRTKDQHEQLEFDFGWK